MSPPPIVIHSSNGSTHLVQYFVSYDEDIHPHNGMMAVSWPRKTLDNEEIPMCPKTSRLLVCFIININPWPLISRSCDMWILHTYYIHSKQEYTSNIPIYMMVLSLATPKSLIALLISWFSTLKCISCNEKVHLGCSMLCFLQNFRWCRIVLDWVGRAIIIYFKSWYHTVYI